MWVTRWACPWGRAYDRGQRAGGGGGGGGDGAADDDQDSDAHTLKADAASSGIGFSGGGGGSSSSSTVSSTVSATGRGVVSLPCEVSDDASFLRRTASFSNKSQPSETTPRASGGGSIKKLMETLREGRQQAFRELCVRDREEARRRYEQGHQRLMEERRRTESEALRRSAVADRAYFTDGRVPDVEALRRFKQENPVSLASLGFAPAKRPE